MQVKLSQIAGKKKKSPPCGSTATRKRCLHFAAQVYDSTRVSKAKQWVAADARYLIMDSQAGIDEQITCRKWLLLKVCRQTLKERPSIRV